MFAIYDLAIIGSGPAGYTAAIRAAQLGMKVVCIEQNNTLGGTCLNVGCIPSKALLHYSYEYHKAKSLKDIGIESNVSLNLPRMMQSKEKVVSDLCKGINGLFGKNKIKRIIGHANIVNSNTIQITQSAEQNESINVKKILIATGSKVASIPNIDIDEKMIISSTGALELNHVPDSMVVIGGGYIGLELGSVWNKLGSNVNIIEYSDRIVPALDRETGRELHKILKQQSMTFHLSCGVESIEKNHNSVTVHYSNKDTGEKHQIESSVALIAIGRKPRTDNLGLENVGINTDTHGYIPVNANYQTQVRNIYAVGDVIKGPMLAHKAEEEAIAAIEIINGKYAHVNYGTIPSVIYTHPEVASVGKTQEELDQAGIEYKIGKFPFMANSRARSIGSSNGFVKILADASNDKILGAHIIGPEAGNLIHEICVVMEFGGSAEDLAKICRAHPTLNEAVKEAALNVENLSINF